MAASEELLGQLHAKLTQRLLDALDGEDLTPALLTAAAKFLKDNGIECEEGNELVEKLKTKATNVLSFPFDPRRETA